MCKKYPKINLELESFIEFDFLRTIAKKTSEVFLKQ